MRYLFLLAFVSSLTAGDVDWVKRMQSLRVLQDSVLSSQAADEALQSFPNNPLILEWAARLYADSGEEKKMFEILKRHHSLRSEWDRDLLEDISWGVIQRGVKSQAPMTRIVALIAGAISNDARGVQLLVRGCQDSNRVVRLLSAEFAGYFRDAALQEAVMERIAVEKDFAVRMTLIKSCGRMGLTATEPFLLEVIGNERARAEERVSAISSLVCLKESVDQREIESFAKSPRAGLRALASELIRFNDRKEQSPLLLPLFKDRSVDVRMSAIETAGVLRMEGIPESLMDQLVHDPSPQVAMRAAWLCMLSNPEKGQKLLKPYLESMKSEERQFAAVMLKYAGKYGQPLTLQVFRKTNDPIVRLNLAEALIEQKLHSKEGAQALSRLLEMMTDRLAKKSSGIFEWIGIYGGEQDEAAIPNFREASNQIIRLELINLVAMEGDPNALETVKSFLRERSWGVTGAAASLLLTEGEPETLEIIQKLLQDPSDKVRLQAALILGSWGGSEEAISTLEQLYFKAQREQKEQILEALGKIGSVKSLDFLVERLNEPQQVLRMIAAAAILQTLYH